MSQVKLYGVAQSRTSRPLWMLEELGIDYEREKVKHRTPAVQTAEYLALNPNGRVPTMVDGDLVLWESMAINLYLAKKYSLGKLYPSDPKDEALAWQWSFWGIAHIEPAGQAWSAQLYAPAEKRSDAAIAEAFADLAPFLATIDTKLAANPYLLGSDFTVADLNVASIMLRYSHENFPTVACMSAWLKRCYERPSAARIREMREKGN